MPKRTRAFCYLCIAWETARAAATSRGRANSNERPRFNARPAQAARTNAKLTATGSLTLGLRRAPADCSVSQRDSSPPQRLEVSPSHRSLPPIQVASIDKIR
jgi:hypothetical protein